MTDARITSQEIFLTPLSPLHIGCGEDYEPTNYVILRNVLYSFDPSVVPMDAALRKEFLSAVRSGSIPSVVKFFQRNAETFLVFAENALPVCGQCVKTYRLMAEKGEGRNQNKIARTTYCATNDGDAYYLPGSALKGVIHTALLNRVNAGAPRDIKDDLDRKVLDGTFSNSPMRFLKVADLLTTQSVPSRIIIAKRCYKGDGVPLTQKGEFWAAFEILERGAVRPFKGSLGLTPPNAGQRASHVYGSVKEIFTDLNAYYTPILKKEVEKYARFSEGRAWSDSFSQLLRKLEKDIRQNRVAVIRIGKNVGAESIVLQGGIASIYKEKGKTSTKTEWRVMDGQETLPFGWCLLERSDDPVREAVKSFCARQPETPVIDLTDLFEKRKALLEEARRKEAEETALRAEEAKKRLLAEEAARADEIRRSQLSPEKLLLEDMVKKLKATSGDVKPGSELYNETWNFLQTALSWSVDLQIEVARELGPVAKAKNMYQGKKAKELKAVFRALRQEN